MMAAVEMAAQPAQAVFPLSSTRRGMPVPARTCRLCGREGLWVPCPLARLMVARAWSADSGHRCMPPRGSCRLPHTARDSEDRVLRLCQGSLGRQTLPGYASIRAQGRAASTSSRTFARHRALSFRRSRQNSPPSAVHMHPASPQDTPLPQLAGVRGYSHVGSSSNAVAHSLSPFMHIAIHKVSRVTCGPCPADSGPAFLYRGLAQ